VQVNIKNLINDIQCYQTVRELRWPDGIACPSCASKQVIKRGFDDTEPARQRYECHDCHTRFAQIIAVCSSAKPCEIGENLLSVSDLTSRPQERLIHAGALVRPSTLQH